MGRAPSMNFMTPVEEVSFDVFQRCARAAGLVDLNQALPEEVERFGLMVALECAEIADRTAAGSGAGESIRSFFLD